ncbi:hypothetical protein Sar04_15010 [Salinispora arenicola]|uniref:Uncharacterized protein DUF2690 n=2 Tax=Salinispora arenicola TaxID=168697 RepID=A0A542XK89_SALAC|nr:uncharacterized protein DUF2690 [Salinispora arenicola]GIM83981.1 hypothetical protein Sar04_15010 [Salinispora arenicola]
MPIEDTCRNNGGGGYVSCNGRDPEEMNCGQKSTVASFTSGNRVTVYLRYSASCQAYWTKYYNPYGNTGEARIKGATSTFGKTLAAYEGESGWTRMLSAAQNPKPCMFFKHSAWGWVEDCNGV